MLIQQGHHTMKDQCEAKDCELPAKIKDLCHKHYARFKRTGVTTIKTPQDRIMENILVNTETGCWEWQGRIEVTGYGGLSYKDKTQRAHRFAYTVFKGPIPKGMYVCHHCDVRHCVNPDHLFPGSHKDNMRDMTGKGRQACGEENGQSKLTNAGVLQIRTRVRGGESQVSVAKDVGISTSVINNIVKGKTWKWLPV